MPMSLNSLRMSCAAASRTTGEKQKQFAEQRDDIAKKMSSQQITEAQRLAREWKPVKRTK
jgi:hypothetical protein